MAAAVAGSTEALQLLNETLEVRGVGGKVLEVNEMLNYSLEMVCELGLDVAEVVKVDDNLAERDYKLMVQNINGKIDEQQELSKPIMNEVCDAPGEFVKDNYDLNYLTQMADELGVKITEFKKKQGYDVGEAFKVDDKLNYWPVRHLELKAKKRLAQRFQNLDQMIHEKQVLSKLIMNEVRDAPGESVKDNDDLNYLKEVVAKLEDKITEFKKKQGADSFTDQL